ncbi:tetratricopeptide repeat protein [Glaciibacter flavus]|uniref:tetratricopeptide repeat protein n=1 Tax=Orlajensenia flava TaxID=2565934 RepID=UPI003B00408A
MLADDPTRQSGIELPDPPSPRAQGEVSVWSEPLVIDTYLPEAPSAYPAFLKNRVYQGSSGRVFPLPFHERISATKQPHSWQAIHLENDWLRIVILPELGGRIHIAYDKINQYDMFYRNNVIKPALVGLAGPWISGGIEFNWPQHHRPATFLPTDVAIEQEADGSVTVWCSDHDPFARMKGMHGIRLTPTSSRIEARVRLYNRSETRQTFLWWANVAAAVNDDYQSFFPTDVDYVADHAKRAVASFPRPTAPYYGIDYRARADASHPDSDRLDWYRNIPVPTSYMVTSTEDEFFGGYDHARHAGFVHWADRSVSPGKKLWTWGNAPFGWAWDGNLTDDDGPYVELMAGVFTDNQPDFAFLSPGETKTFSQYWYPIGAIGPAQQANRDIAGRMDLVDGELRIGLVASASLLRARLLVIGSDGGVILDEVIDLNPDRPVVRTVVWRAGIAETASLTVNAAGVERFAMSTAIRDHRPEPPHAEEPAAPSDVQTIDELVGVAIYLEQFRHATRRPEPYWQEVIARDPGESRATAALGALAYSRADYDSADRLLRQSIARTTRWAATPTDGTAHYLLGLTLGRRGESQAAAESLARASWDACHAASAGFSLARELSKSDRAERAIAALESVLEHDPNHLQASDLLALLLTSTGRAERARAILARTLSIDPLDQWALHQTGGPTTGDATIMLDVALEYAAAGFLTEGLTALDEAARLVPELATGQTGVGPLIRYHQAALLLRMGRDGEAASAIRAAAAVDSQFALPSRLDDIDALERVLEFAPGDSLARALLGHWMYDRERVESAMAYWRSSLDSGADASVGAVVHRNLGIASYNVLHDVEAADRHYRAALELRPDDPKLWSEFDQLCARRGFSAAERLHQLEERADVVAQRDDLVVAFAQLLIENSRAGEALALLTSRRFQPWEGGEGQVLAAWDGALLTLARSAMRRGEAREALRLVETALRPPSSLGEGRHTLANIAEVHLVAGDANEAAGDHDRAVAHWQLAADSTSDFTKMAATRFSTQTIHAVRALRRLGRDGHAEELMLALSDWSDWYSRQPMSIDFFATSLPNMLLFVDDPVVERDRLVALIREQLTTPVTA